MAISKTAIANRALSKLGEPRVSNIETTNSNAAETIREMWDSVRDAMLQSYPWNFAIARKSIAADATAPDWEYNNRYRVPTGYLALLEVKNDPDYVLEGSFILTDEGTPLKIRYIQRIEDTAQFDTMFDEALAAELAVQACESITQSNTKKQILMSERDAAIKAAFASDAIQEPPQTLRPDTWLTSREEGYDDEIDYSTA